MLNVIIYGAGGQGKTAVEVIEDMGIYRLLGFVDDRRPAGETVCGYPILGDSAALSNPEIAGGVVAIGDNWSRHLAVERIRALRPDFTFIKAIHPSCEVSRRAEIGPGALILHQCKISTEARLGAHCYMASQSVVGHEAILGDYVNLANHCCVSGGAKVGSFSSLGPGVSMLQMISVGEHTIIGAASAVTRDIGSRLVAYGIPCKPVRTRTLGERFL